MATKEEKESIIQTINSLKARKLDLLEQRGIIDVEIGNTNIKIAHALGRLEQMMVEVQPMTDLSQEEKAEEQAAAKWGNEE